MSVTWNYNGSTTLTAVVTGATNGDKYRLVCDDDLSTPVTQTASGGTVTLTVTDIGGATTPFDAVVEHGDSSTVSNADGWVAANIFSLGTPDTVGTSYTATWAYVDSTNTISVTFTAASGVAYILDASQNAGGGFSSGGPYTAGTSHTLSLVITPPTSHEPTFGGLLLQDGGPAYFTNRLFVTGTDSSGTAGNPANGGGGGGGSGQGFPGVRVAFSNNALDASPTYTDLNLSVTSWSIDRGRSYELDQTSTGTAQVTLVDLDGTFDPTNPGSPYSGLLDPMKPAQIVLQNPVDATTHTLFSGFVAGWSYLMDVSEKVCFVTLDLVDGFDLLSALEMTPGNVGDATPAGSEGDIYFDGIDGMYGGSLDDKQPGDNGHGDQGRINDALDDAGWPGTLRNIFSGNVALQENVYARRDSLITVLFDAADAEFPGVSNLYMSRDGKVRFRGRFARFNPTDSQYGINLWNAGDTAALLDSSYAAISELMFARDKTNLINAAIALPQGVQDTDVPASLVTDTASIAKYGWRSKSFPNLLLAHGEIAPMDNAVTEAKKYATYYVDNYATPRTRVSQITFRPGDTTSDNAAAMWNLVCGVEISDLVHLKTTHPGGGGFNEDFFVEGIHYQAIPLNSSFPEITLTLDVSPRAYYDTGPFTTAPATFVQPPTDPTVPSELII